MSGPVNFNETCSCPAQSSTVQQTFAVQQVGLQALPSPGQGYTSTPSNYHGTQNLNAIPEVVSRLQGVPLLFASTATQANVGPAVTLTYTGLSLPLGGLFDLNGDWASPHCAHRDGRNADILIVDTSVAPAVPKVPVSQRRALATAIYALGFTMPVLAEQAQNESANHWHLVR